METSETKNTKQESDLLDLYQSFKESKEEPIDIKENVSLKDKNRNAVNTENNEIALNVIPSRVIDITELQMKDNRMQKHQRIVGFVVLTVLGLLALGFGTYFMAFRLPEVYFEECAPIVSGYNVKIKNPSRFAIRIENIKLVTRTLSLKNPSSSQPKLNGGQTMCVSLLLENVKVQSTNDENVVTVQATYPLGIKQTLVQKVQTEINISL
jgi:hypothetical protein